MITQDGRKSRKSAGFAVILIKGRSRFQSCPGPMVQAEAEAVIQAASLQVARPAAAAQAALEAVHQAAAVQAAAGSLMHFSNNVFSAYL